MRSPYTSNWSFERPSLFTGAIKLLVSINIIIFLLQTISRQERILFHLFGIVPRLTWSQLMIWQPFTYLFFHGGIWHVLINMFVLWMFGSELERCWGKKEFFKYYFLTGVGSGLVTILFNYNSMIPVVGASGAIYGILLAFGLMFPNRYVYLYFLFPIRVKYFVIFIGAITLFSSLRPGTSNVSHLTHLSGLLIGYVYLRTNLGWSTITTFIHEWKNVLRQKRAIRRMRKKETLRREIDQILDKINMLGYDGLTEKEKEFLYKASKKIAQREERN